MGIITAMVKSPAGMPELQTLLATEGQSSDFISVNLGFQIGNQ